MFTKLTPHVLAALAVSAFVAACAADSGLHSSVATTTGATVYGGPALDIAKARCHRAAECNRIEGMYGDKDQCMSRETDAAHVAVVTCTEGVDSRRLDDCLASLESQACDADMGPIDAMPGCSSFCSR